VADLERGARIAGRYVVVDVLGKGGTSIVYRASDRDGREVAVKVLRFTDDETARRARREAQAMRRLDPARVAQLYEVGETEDREPYIAMELVHGTSGRALLAGGALDAREALRITREIGITLDAAHRLGLVHRDVKPDNILVRDDGRVVLLDFGIVKCVQRDGERLLRTTWLTEEGTLIGTPAYLAPEQALGEDLGPAADQFALAVVAFELLTGRSPWAAKEPTHVIAQILGGTPLAPSAANPRLPRAFDPVFARAMAKGADERFPSIEAFVAALAAAERGEELPSQERAKRVETAERAQSVRVSVRVKGVNFRSFLAAFERLRGAEAVERALSLLPTDLGDALRLGALTTSGWYSADWYRALHYGAQRACLEGPALSRAIARDAIAEDFRAGVYRLVTLTLSPEAIFRWAPRVVGSYFDRGRIVIEQAEPGLAMGRFEGFHGFDRNLWEDMIGGAVGVLELAGAKKLAPRVLAGGGDGDAHMSYSLRWTS